MPTLVNHMRFSWLIGVLCLLVISLGIVSGLLLYGRFERRTTTAQASAQYRYINTALHASGQQVQSFSENIALKGILQTFINNKVKEGTIKNASLYLRNLEAGTWVAINEEAQFSPGKLLKIPLMIAYYKLAESRPEILEQKILFTKSKITIPPLFEIKNPLVANHTYTIQELIERMIVESNDDAANLLFATLDKDTLNEIFSDLGITFNEDKATQDVITLKLYSLFFRVLYNTTYVNREYSEKALELLVRADNTFGLGAQLPTTLLIANRYGARSLVLNSSSVIQMYECAIVYYPQHPYLLCALTQGNSLHQVEEFLGDLGKRVYQAMSSS